MNNTVSGYFARVCVCRIKCVCICENNCTGICKCPCLCQNICICEPDMPVEPGDYGYDPVNKYVPYYSSYNEYKFANNPKYDCTNRSDVVDKQESTKNEDKTSS